MSVYRDYKCFPPVIDSYTKVLILGSIPGLSSLENKQYYAHPQNHFWYLIGRILANEDWRTHDYLSRIRRCQSAGLGIWAAIARCQRIGSSDSSIRNGQAVDLPATLEKAKNTDLRAVFFDGRKAEAIFMRLAYPHLPSHLQKLPFQYLPSSSPAWAAMSVDKKLQHWQTIAEFLQ